MRMIAKLKFYQDVVQVETRLEYQREEFLPIPKGVSPLQKANQLNLIFYIDVGQRQNSDVLSQVDFIERLDEKVMYIEQEGGADDSDVHKETSNCNNDRLSISGNHGVVEGEEYPDECPSSGGNG